MIENAKVGDRIWAIDKDNLAYEFQIIQPNTQEYLWVKATRKKLGYYDNPTVSLQKEFGFPSKEALLQHLSDTAIPLPTEGEHKA